MSERELWGLRSQRRSPARISPYPLDIYKLSL